MKQFVMTLSVVFLSAVVAFSCVADDAPKKKGNQGGKKNAEAPAFAQMMKTLEKVELSDEQKAQIKQLAGKLQEETKALREEGLTMELTKKRAEVMKAAREAGKKGKELQAAGDEGFSEEEKAVLAKAGAAQTKFRNAVFALLTDEQKEVLPAAAKRNLAPQQAKGKGKKAKAEA